MKKTTKVTLFSLLVFPGIGHFILKKYAMGIIFIASFSYLLISFIQEIYATTQKVIDDVLQGNIAMDTVAIQKALIEQSAIDNSNLSTISYLMLSIWLAAAFDAYRLANKKQQSDSVNTKKH